MWAFSAAVLVGADLPFQALKVKKSPFVRAFYIFFSYLEIHRAGLAKRNSLVVLGTNGPLGHKAPLFLCEMNIIPE